MTQLNDDMLAPLIDRLDLERKVELLTGRDSWSLHPVPEIGLDSLVLSDGPAGVRGDTWDERSPSINFPSPTALAASWDRGLVRDVGRALGSEARDKGVHVLLAPTINLHRTPYGGRHFEAFSEDPLLTGDIAAAYVAGVQELGVGATVKHYVANDSETDRFEVDVRVSDRALRELYLLAFEEPVVDAGAWLVMSAYNAVNGTTMSENGLLSTPLNDEWAFDGVVVSDWTAVRSLDSALVPQDLVMPGPSDVWGRALVAAVRDGRVPEALIDRKVRRILRLAARTGALRGHGPAASAEPLPLARRREAARRASADGMVLLENRELLPLDAPTSIAVIGEGARFARTQGGGSATVIPASVSSPLAGIRERWPDAEVEWSLGAVVQSGLADIELSRLETPSGEPGILVRYLDEQGGLLAEEVRAASGIVSFDAAALGSRSAVVEFSFRYRPEAGGGAVPFGLAGLSDYEVVADGVPVAAGELRTRPGDDPATAVLNPPWTAFDLPVGPTGAVDLAVRFRPVAGGIPGALAFRVGLPPLRADADALIRDAARAAADAEIAVVVVSTSAEVESEGFDRTSLRLPGRQDDLVRAVAAANPRTVVVVNSGAPVLLPWRSDAGAVLACWFPGQEFGAALADVLSGDREPGGRLPVTWPSTEEDVPVSTVRPVDGKLRYDEGIHIGHRAWLRNGAAPAYPFGHGLGYTDWRLSNLRTAPEVRLDSGIEIAVDVENTGDRPGKTVVQVYLERTDPSEVDRPVRWLAGHQVVRADAGETARIAVPLAWRRFAHWAGGWSLEPGAFRVRVGFSAAALLLEADVAVIETNQIIR